MPVLGGSAGGGGVTEVSAVADGAIANGSPVIQSGDGKIAVPNGNIAANVADNATLTAAQNNVQSYTFYNPITFVDRAAGRGIVLATRGSAYNYQAQSKLFTVNTTTGAGITGSGQSSSLNPLGSDNNYCQYPIGAIWDSTTGSWMGAYRRNNSGSSYLVMFKAKTSNGLTQSAAYKHDFGGTNQYSLYSSNYICTRFIEARGFKYIVNIGGTQPYGRDSCMVLGPFTWSSDANDGGAFGAAVLATDYASYNVSLDAIYDSSNQQIVVVTSKAITPSDQSLFAFDVAANGTVTYSHSLMNAGGSVAGQIRAITTNESGDIVWSELNSKKLYAAKNTGSAFTKGNSIDWPSGVYAQVAMAYNPTIKNFVATYVLSAGTIGSPTHLIFGAGNGNLSATTKETTGTGSQFGSYQSYVGYFDGPNSAFKIPGNYVATSDTFVQYNVGNADNNTISEINSNKIATSNTFTGAYIGLAKAAISDGATGKVTTKGAINESQSGLAAGIRYAVTATGTVQTESSLTETEQATAVFLGTATAADSMLVGDSLTVTDEGAVNKKVPKSVLRSGSSMTQGQAGNWTTNLTVYGLNTDNVSATGTNTIFKATGKGVVLYFMMANQSGNSGTNVDVFIDGVKLFNTGTFSTGPNYCLSLVGEWRANDYSTHNYSGNLAATDGYQFNKSFEVRRNVACTSTSFSIGYKILSV